MIPKDLFQKVRRIEITTSRLVSDVFAGQYHSVFKGQGLEFDEVREYQPGDDIRSIDWNVTARTGHPHVKKYIEEREQTVMILVDASASCRFASWQMLKNQLAAELSALLALSAIRNNDKVGLIIFTDRIEKFIPPRKGRQHVLRVIREVLYFTPEGQSTNIVQALEYLNRVTTRKTISFLISDFMDVVPKDRINDADAFKKTLAIANKKHDVVAVTLNDPLETQMSGSGLVTLQDAETGESITLDTSSARWGQEYELYNQERIKQRERLFRSVGVDFIDIDTHTSYADAVIKFFLKRRRKK